MSEDINDLIKSVKRNGEVLTHKVTDPSLRVSGFRNSTYIQKHNILVKGEESYFKKSDGALLVLFDLLSGTVKGESNLFVCPRVTKRLWKDLQLANSQLSRPLRV